MTGSRVIELLPYDPSYATRATEEAKRISDVLGVVIVRVEHIGSTAIPGMCAKPIIDLLPIVHTLDALDKRINEMERAGYELRGEYGMPGRRYCVRHAADGRRRVNAHCLALGNSAIARNIAFRDYLRAHPHEAKSYKSEKLRAAAQSPYDAARYNDLKSAWIADCQARALTWAATG